MKLGYLAAVALLLCVPLAAQTTKETDGKAAARKTAAKPADKKPADAKAAPQGPPKPSPEMAKMTKLFLGKWDTTISVEATPFGPADKGTGTEIIRKGPGGFSLINDSTARFEKAGPFTGHGVVYYDAAAKAFNGTWCDSWSPACMPGGTGNFDGDKLVLTSSSEMDGHTLKFRHTYTFSEKGYVYALEMADPSGAMKPWMTFTYTRAATMPPAAEKK